MFHRRLLLLLAGTGVGFSLLAMQMTRLAVGRGDSALALAESKLVRRQMTPTVRGRILDRQGRILAQDRPSYDAAVAYDVLAGAWASDKARAFVRRAFREQWSELSDTQRRDLIDRAEGAYERHLRDGWDALAAKLATTSDELRTRREEAVAQVRRMHESVSTRSVDAAQAEFTARHGRDPTPEERAAIRKRASAPIQEMKSARVLYPRVPDAVAFAIQDLADDRVDLKPLGDDAGSLSVDRLERMPGLRIFDAGDRDYPLDSMMVDVDGSALPSPIRSRRMEDVFVEGVASHLVGWMRPLWTDDEQSRRRRLADDPAFADRVTLDLHDGAVKDRGEYLDGDRAGQAGVEGSRESELRGLRGMRTRQVDTGQTQEIPAEPGRDVRLTIDAMLQARVQAAMTPSLGLARVQPWHRSATEPANPTMPDGTPINGAAVVLDIDTGEILAMVSTPPVPARLRRDDPESVFDDPVNLPHLNRAVNRPYPPGSIVKPMVLVEAIRLARHAVDARIECTGHLLPNKPDSLQCWIWKRYKLTHSSQLEHDLDGTEAVMVSCNIFFFSLGRTLGPDGIVSAYRRFGVGAGWNLGIGPEYPGGMGRTGDGSGLQQGDAIQMGIGQGPITWTPLHAAAAYATLARGGTAIRPRIVAPSNIPGAKGDTPNPLGAVEDLELSAASVAAAIHGLDRAVNDDLGTGHVLTFHRAGVLEKEPIFNVPGVRVIGKTGTATAPDLLVQSEDPKASVLERQRESESDGVNSSVDPLRPPEVVRSGDHSWFVVLAGPEGDRAKYAIAVVMEYAGSGGRVSGPICNQIVHALVREGYITPSPSSKPVAPPTSTDADPSETPRDDAPVSPDEDTDDPPARAPGREGRN
jgi:penicillin-binding protein 2